MFLTFLCTLSLELWDEYLFRVDSTLIWYSTLMIWSIWFLTYSLWSLRRPVQLSKSLESLYCCNLPLSLKFILQTQYYSLCLLSSMIFISDPVTLVVYLLNRSFVDVYNLLLKQCQIGFQVIFINFDQRTGLQSACAVATNSLFFFSDENRRGPIECDYRFLVFITGQHRIH